MNKLLKKALGFRRLADPVCFLHVGPHKTGTSSIQNYLARNNDWLDKRGVSYPILHEANGRALKHHAPLTKFPRGQDTAKINLSDPNWRVVAEIAAKARRNIVLSSELFGGRFRNKRKLDAVLDVFDRFGYGVKVLFYVRDQPIWLNSWYMQSQKRFITPQDFDAFVEAADGKGFVDPYSYLTHLIDNPRLTLEVVSFEAAVKAGLERDFLARIGVDPAESPDPEKPMNQNAGAKTVYAAQEIMRRTGANIRKLPHYNDIYRRFRAAYERLGWNDDPYIGLNEVRTAAIRARYRDRNERLAEAYLGRPWVELVGDRTHRPKMFDPATASLEETQEVEAVIAEMIALIDGGSKSS